MAGLGFVLHRLRTLVSGRPGEKQVQSGKSGGGGWENNKKEKEKK